MNFNIILQNFILFRRGVPNTPVRNTLVFPLLEGWEAARWWLLFCLFYNDLILRKPFRRGVARNVSVGNGEKSESWTVSAVKTIFLNLMYLIPFRRGVARNVSVENGCKSASWTVSAVKSIFSNSILLLTPFRRGVAGNVSAVNGHKSASRTVSAVKRLHNKTFKNSTPFRRGVASNVSAVNGHKSASRTVSAVKVFFSFYNIRTVPFGRGVASNVSVWNGDICPASIQSDFWSNDTDIMNYPYHIYNMYPSGGGVSLRFSVQDWRNPIFRISVFLNIFISEIMCLFFYIAGAMPASSLPLLSKTSREPFLLIFLLNVLVSIGSRTASGRGCACAISVPDASHTSIHDGCIASITCGNNLFFCMTGAMPASSLFLLSKTSREPVPLYFLFSVLVSVGSRTASGRGCACAISVPDASHTSIHDGCTAGISSIGNAYGYNLLFSFFIFAGAMRASSLRFLSVRKFAEGIKFFNLNVHHIGFLKNYYFAGALRASSLLLLSKTSREPVPLYFIFGVLVSVGSRTASGRGCACTISVPDASHTSIHDGCIARTSIISIGNASGNHFIFKDFVFIAGALRAAFLPLSVRRFVEWAKSIFKLNALCIKLCYKYCAGTVSSSSLPLSVRRFAEGIKSIFKLNALCIKLFYKYCAGTVSSSSLPLSVRRFAEGIKSNVNLNMFFTTYFCDFAHGSCPQGLYTFYLSNSGYRHYTLISDGDPRVCFFFFFHFCRDCVIMSLHFFTEIINQYKK
ncbi:MAG: hypothetical protein LBD59_08710 [Prevotellaceae bacterium]|jgi:hypothetical protein|nr:hypothetical protein [Prevotellaceae bacterium]